MSNPNSEIESAGQSEENSRWHYVMIPVPGVFLSPELVQEYRRAAEENEKSHDEQDPPKPPRRPNARLGRTALGLGF